MADQEKSRKEFASILNHLQTEIKSHDDNVANVLTKVVRF